MASPGIVLGSLNRLKASILFPNFPGLDVVPSYLAPEGIDFDPQGQSTAVLPAMTGVVTSPEPYMLVRVAIHLLKSQSFAAAWKLQLETNTLLGPLSARPDTAAIPAFSLDNTSIVGIDRMSFSGREPGFVVNIVGSYQINAYIWDS